MPFFEVDYGLHVDRETSNMGCSAMTEDLPFCDKCHEAGFDIWVDTSIQCHHFDKHSGQMFGINDSMPQAQRREPRKSTTLYIGTLLAGGEPAHILAPDASLKPTWVGTPDKVPTEETYGRVCVKDPDIKRSALSEVVKEWARVTKPGGTLEVMHPDYAEWISEGREFKANALYPADPIKVEMEKHLTEVISKKAGDHYIIGGRKSIDTETLVSILVLAHGMEDMTRQCVESLRHTEHDDFDFEVVLIDNGSPVPLEGMGDRVIRNEDNLPFGVAMMEALKTVKSPYVLLLNNDTVAHKPNWLSNLLLRIRGNGQIVGIGPKQVTPAGTIYWAGTVFTEERIPFHHSLGVAHDHPAVQTESPTFALNFGCALLRSDALRTWPLDEAFELNYEDVDWCLQVRSKGMVVLYTPSSEIVHIGGQTQATDPERSKRTIEEGRAYLAKKWKDAPPELFGQDSSPEADEGPPEPEEIFPETEV
jgi:GT2 family glycosyltransferase